MNRVHYCILLCLLCFGMRTQATVTILDLPEKSSAPLGMVSKIEVTANGDGELNYQWYEGDNPISGATQAVLTIPSQNTPGTRTFRVRINDDDSEVYSEWVSLVAFDVATELGIPGYHVEVDRSVEDKYTEMLPEDGGVFLDHVPNHYLTKYPYLQQASPQLTVSIEGSALVKVTFSGGLQLFANNSPGTNNGQTNSFLYDKADRSFTNYFLGDGPHSLILFPWDPIIGYRYGASVTIRKVEILPIPNNNFLADIYRKQFNDTGSISQGDIEDLDFDGDGRSNLLEWMQFTDPFEIDEGIPLEFIEINGERFLQFHWIRPLNIYPYTYRFEYTTDLTNWQQVENPVWEATLIPGMDVQARDSVPFSNPPTRFYRIRVFSEP